MSSPLFPCLRHRISAGRSLPLLQTLQKRHARVHDVRFLATHIDPEAKVVDKYREKLRRKARAEGLRDEHELREAYKAKIEAARRKAASLRSSSALSSTDVASESTITSTPTSSPFPAAPPAPQASQSYNQSPPSSSTAASRPPPGVKPLSAYLDIPKTLALPSETISNLWRLRHASSPTSLCATIPLETYTNISATARQHPQFILPLPRKDSSTETPKAGAETDVGTGAEIHFLQWTFPTPTTATVLFTHLAEYKLRGEYAQPHTTITHHLDLAPEKGIVLLVGQVVEGRGVSVEEAKWLVMCLQRFYGGVGEREQEGKRRRLLEMFSQGDGGFRVEDLVEEAERVI
ncbi:MAG: hypothetical protein M1817_001784 [Caeruleum heppii]|nr:MAG: hypothetical protein M1817_001784 [Caeruleum heppii]